MKHLCFLHYLSNDRINEIDPTKNGIMYNKWVQTNRDRAFYEPPNKYPRNAYVCHNTY